MDNCGTIMLAPHKPVFITLSGSSALVTIGIETVH